MISNIVFTKNRPLQLEAYLESLYRYFPSDLIRTYIIYKVELFTEEYGQVFNRFPDCVVIRESDFHTDFMKILDQVQTKYILFGIDDVVFFDTVNFDVIDRTFSEQGENIFGFTLRFSPESLQDSGDHITECSVSGKTIYRVNWKEGQTKHTRYPFELCCTFYTTDTVKKIIANSMTNNPLAKSMFTPDSPLIKFLEKLGSKRGILKRCGYFFSPNTLESWPCRWCKRNKHQLPEYTYFQKQCASAIQVNMVNTTRKGGYDAAETYTVETLNEKYKNNYRFDIDSLVKNRPSEPGCDREYFRLIKRQ